MRETSRGLGNGLTQTIIYNLDNTISQKSVAGITNFSYTYDQNKRKLTETDSIMTNLSQTFSYDFEDRLTSWTSNGTTLNQTQSWNLSLEGAWNSTTVNGNTENRTFNQTYEILTSNANAMSHDRKGNLTTNKDGSVYTWDFDNQMAFSTSGTPSVNAAYAYDALGRRVSKSSGNTVTIFVNSGYQILTEYTSISNGPFTEAQSFVYATYIDDPIALISTNVTYFYHSNQQFSIGAITDSNGNLSERYGYNAYGKTVIMADSILVDNPYFFTGRQLDSETGLFYFRARYYDASLGQFVSRDPLNYVDGMNLYRGYFAVNDLDPSGLDTTLYSEEIKDKDGKICGLVTVYKDDKGFIHFKMDDSKRDKECGCCKNSEFGWVQHVSDGPYVDEETKKTTEDWRYDNGTLRRGNTGRMGGVSSPGSNISPGAGESNPWYGAMTEAIDVNQDGIVNDTDHEDFAKNPKAQEHIADKPGTPSNKINNFKTELHCGSGGAPLFCWQWSRGSVNSDGKKCQ